VKALDRDILAEMAANVTYGPDKMGTTSSSFLPPTILVGC